MRGAPQVGFSATIRKIKARISFEIGLLPGRPRNLELGFRATHVSVECNTFVFFLSARNT
jgi:hypothetical protein